MVQQLGASVGALSSAYFLKRHLASLQELFRKNAADLFSVVTPEKFSPTTSRHVTKHAGRSVPLLKIPENTSALPNQLDEILPDYLDLLANSLNTLLFHVNAFASFNDDKVDEIISSFARDAKVPGLPLISVNCITDL